MLPPNLSFLKTFGCIAYAHVKLGKLEPKAIKCMFIGYPEGTKGYKLWNFKSRKSLISRDVNFRELEPYMISVPLSQDTNPKEDDLSSEMEVIQKDSEFQANQNTSNNSNWTEDEPLISSSSQSLDGITTSPSVLKLKT